MSQDKPHKPSPYVGLNAFRKADRAYFFGREKDIALIGDNLQAHRLTILYGPSGVGKSSVLQAGVIPYLEEVSATNQEKSLIIFLNSWQDNPYEDLQQALKEKAETLNITLEADEPLALISHLSEETEVQVYFIFDQFEEYFLYHSEEDLESSKGFAYQLVALCNDLRLNVNVLISLRDDGFALLDRFKGSIPQLFDNYLRLKKLDRVQPRAPSRGRY
ncbi:MAG: ATP-binding protein [Deinococcales bacterium]